ncbi:MAG: hypothetical protein KKF48_01585 [Nanoarchaeota archaeon]|nr:hypothetical protein [Nanoarchaeota archaeon]MBU1027713.1 hypothetical protein [Nanoarchaeota archaeon]
MGNLGKIIQSIIEPYQLPENIVDIVKVYKKKIGSIYTYKIEGNLIIRKNTLTFKKVFYNLDGTKASF